MDIKMIQIENKIMDILGDTPEYRVDIAKKIQEPLHKVSCALIRLELQKRVVHHYYWVYSKA